MYTIISTVTYITATLNSVGIETNISSPTLSGVTFIELSKRTRRGLNSLNVCGVGFKLCASTGIVFNTKIERHNTVTNTCFPSPFIPNFHKASFLFPIQFSLYFFRMVLLWQIQVANTLF